MATNNQNPSNNGGANRGTADTNNAGHTGKDVQAGANAPKNAMHGLTSDIKPPKTNDPVQIASEMSMAGSDAPASSRPRGYDATLPHSALQVDPNDEAAADRAPKRKGDDCGCSGRHAQIDRGGDVEPPPA